VGELSDRRARKKAQTRESIRTTAQRLFAERGFDMVTIADIAREADVAMQTVFSHFPTKEELFFDGHTPWVDAVAEAVRSREPSVPPLSALRAYLVDLVGSLVGSLATEERRSYIATLEASVTLRTQERELVFESERRLTAALREAWTDTTDKRTAPVPTDPQTAAPLTAAMWMAAVRSLVIGQRPLVTEGADPCKIAAAVEDLAERLLGQLETDSGPLHGLSEHGLSEHGLSEHGLSEHGAREDSGRPRTVVRQAV
jgi:AcrR family transcriptional regulator